MDLSLEDGKILIGLARKTLEEFLLKRKKILIPKNLPKHLYKKAGVFVTLEINGELRGCIGFPYPDKPLVEALIESTINSASEDPRFFPVGIEELPNLTIEISILGQLELLRMEPSEYEKNIIIGKHGLVVERGYFSGLLLPQVAVDFEWNAREFLCQICIKANLPPDAWKMHGTRVYRFEAIVFSEKEPRGEVFRKV
jgi:uncharacterized protein (TIGR00296 family)